MAALLCTGFVCVASLTDTTGVAQVHVFKLYVCMLLCCFCVCVCVAGVIGVPMHLCGSGLCGLCGCAPVIMFCDGALAQLCL